MSKRLGLVCLIVVAAWLGCDRPSPTPPSLEEPPPPRYAIVDAAHSSGNPYFFFMTPLVTSNPPSSGTFDSGALGQLLVEICTPGPAGCAVVRTFSASSGSPLDRIRVDRARQFYLVYWNTAAPVDPATDYRIRVLGGGRELGYIDVDVVSSPAELANVDRSQFAGVVQGDWLPIRFRVDQGALTYNQPPTASITSPADGSSFAPGQVIGFLGAGDDPEDGTLGGAALQWTSDVDGAIGSGTSFSRNDLSPGTHVITLTATDADGATGTAQISITVQANQPPRPSIGAPADGATFTQGQTITFGGMATDPEDGVLTGASLEWTSDVAGSIGTGDTFTRSDLAVGTHIITLTATDSQGATGSAQVTITVTADQAPTATITAPANGASFTQGDNVTFTGSAADPEDGALTGAALQWTSNLDGAIGSGASFATSTLSVGTHTITLTGTDSNGGTGQAQIQITVVGPNQPPTATITAPPDNTVVTEGTSINFTGTGNDPEDGALSGAALQWTSDLDGNLGSGASINAVLSAGTHTITLTATDSDGDSGSAQIQVRVNAQPTATIAAPADGASFVQGTTVTFTGSATDAEDGALSGGALQWTSDRDGAIGSGASFGTSTLTIGTHVITLTATDSDGSTGSAQVTITVTADQAPTATITAPANGSSFTQGDNITFTGSATDPEDGALTGAALQWTSDLDGAIGSGANFTTSTLSVGTHTITLTATDSNGGTGQAQIAITVGGANQPPTATISEPAPAAIFDFGEPITFTGSGTDPEDGPLTGGQLTWTSSIDGAIGTGATFVRSDLSTGTHTITLRATDSQGLFDEATVVITINPGAILLPNTLNVPYGQTASLPIQLSRPAPAGGVTVSVTTSDANLVGLASTTVSIPAGQVAANATAHGVAPGTATVSASAVGYTSDDSQVSTTAALDIIETSVTFPSGRVEPITVRLQSAGSAIAAPTGGITVDLTSADAACVASQQVMIPAGLVSTTADLAYGGSATLPCMTTVTASTPGVPAITTDVVDATINPSPGITVNTNGVRVGSGLQYGSLAVTLGAPAGPGGVTVQLQSSDAALLRLSNLATQAGAGTINLNVPQNLTSANFYVHGIEGATGTATITATATGYTQGSNTVDVVPVAHDILALSTTTTTLTADDEFVVRVGAISAPGNGFYSEQSVRTGGSAITFTVTNSDAAVGQLVTSAGSGQSRTVDVAPGQSRSPTTVASGGIAFDPSSAGTTAVSATSAASTALAGATQNVTVTASGITVNTNGVRVGSGLQYGSLAVTLGAAAGPGGVTVQLQSSDASLLRLSNLATQAGAGTINLNVPQNQTSATFYVHGIEGTTGTATITATATGYTPGSNTVDVVGVAHDILALSNTTTTLTTDDEFVVRLGAISAAGNNFYTEQSVRTGGPAITFTVTNSDATVGELVTGAGPGQSRTVDVQAGQSRSPTTVAAGGIAFDPNNAGTTTVSATSAASTALAGATQTVTVTAPGITLNTTGVRVGSGLQYGAFSVILGAPAGPGGVTVQLQSADASLLRLSNLATQAGAATISLNIPQNQTSATFFLHGIEGSTGTATITATATGYTQGTNTVDVVPVAHDILQLSNTSTTLTPNDPFVLRVGAINTAGTSFYVEQQVRTGGPAVSFTVTNSDAAVGQLVTTAGAAQSRTVDVAAGQSRSPTTLAAGGIEFDPISTGMTTVSATSAASTALAGASQTVTVTAPTITSNANNSRVGSGLQYGVWSFTLGAPAPAGGIDVTLQSSAPGVLLVSPNNSTAGSGSITVQVNAGAVNGSFWVQGMEGATGTATITFSAPGFTNGTAAIEVVPVALDILGVTTTTSAGAPNDLFQVRIGAVNAAGTGFYVEQSVRAGGTSLAVDVDNSNATVAQLVTTAGAAQSAAVTIAAGQSRSAVNVAGGGIEFDPLAPGQTVLSASAPGLVSLAGATQTITVN